MKVAKGAAIVAPLACAVLTGIGCVLPFDLLFNLAFGWGFFLARVVPQLTIDGTGVVTALLCLGALAAGLHPFCRWLYDSGLSPLKADEPKPRRWQPRWTAAILGVVVLMFVAGIAAVGVAHQTAWLMAGPLAEGGIREPATRMTSNNNLKQIGLALHNYHDQYRHLPPGATFNAYGSRQHSWMTLILPHMEEEKLYEQINFKVPWSHADNRTVFETVVSVYRRHPLTPRELPRTKDEAGYALSHYAGNVRIFGSDRSWSLDQIVDGTANTLLAGEVTSNFMPWGQPVNARDPALGINGSPQGFGGPWKSRGAQFIMGDGSVRFLSESTSPDVLKALSTPAGKEEVPEF